MLIIPRSISATSLFKCYQISLISPRVVLQLPVKTMSHRFRDYIIHAGGHVHCCFVSSPWKQKEQSRWHLRSIFFHLKKHNYVPTNLHICSPGGGVKVTVILHISCMSNVSQKLPPLMKLWHSSHTSVGLSDISKLMAEPTWNSPPTLTLPTKKKWTY